MNLRNPLSLLAVALVAFSTTAAQAQVDMQLNLRYDDPANEAAGGSWDLLVQSSGSNGLAGLRVVIDGLSAVTGVNTPGSAITPNADAFDDISSVFKFQPFGGGSAVEIVAGDDLAGALVTGVGSGSGASNVASDDLFPGNSPVWDNSSLLASGTFGATRPAFLEVDATGNLSPGSGVFAIANDFAAIATDPVIAATIGDVSVRGDGVASDGLVIGDINRGGDVDLFGDTLGALGNVGTGTIWDEGDIDSSGGVDLFGDVLTILGNVGMSSTSPPLSAGSAAVPEPGSVVLLSLLAGCLLGVRSRSL